MFPAYGAFGSVECAKVLWLDGVDECIHRMLLGEEKIVYNYGHWCTTETRLDKYLAVLGKARVFSARTVVQQFIT